MKRILFCVVAILLNLLGAWCTRVFELPLYLDSISTIAVAYLCGLTPSLAVAAATNIILLFTFESPLIFTICHLLTAAGAYIAFRFAKSKNKKNFVDLFLLAGLLSAATNAVLGSVFSLAMFQGQQKTPIAGLSDCLLYITNGLQFALFVSGIVTNLADKILSAMFSYLLVVAVKNCHTNLDCHTDLFATNVAHCKQNSKPFFIASLFRPKAKRVSVDSQQSFQRQIRVATFKFSYLTTFLIFIAIANITACFFFQKAYRKISGTLPSLDSSLYLMILTSIILIAACFFIVYAKMIQSQKEKDLEAHRIELSNRMSFNLHDGVLQNLVALKTRMETELHKNESSPEIQLIQTAITEIRLLCGILRLGDEIPFEEALRQTLDAYERTYGFKTKLGIACDLSFLNTTQKTELLHILYECLSNTAQHSNAKNVSVTFADDGNGKLYFTIRDDGSAEKRSLDSARDDKSTRDSEYHPELVSGSLHGLGLQSIQARTATLGGTAEFSQTAEGWVTRIIV